MTQKVSKEAAKKTRGGSRIWLYILFALPPAALITLFYIYKDSSSIANWVETFIGCAL